MSENLKKYYWTVLPAVLVGGALIAGFFIYWAGSKQKIVTEPQLSSEPLLETPKPTSVPTPVLKREDLKLEVLNGRGVTGIADEAKNYLESLGYQAIAVGNADSYHYQQTEISIKEDKEDYLDLLKEDLSEKHLVSEETETLEAESEFDVIIVIGSE